MTDAERDLEAKLRQARSEVLDLRLALHSAEVEIGDLKRRLRVQSKNMEAARDHAREAYQATLVLMTQSLGLE